MILLDTHVIIWTLAGTKIRAQAPQAIEKARPGDKLVVSAISAYEIALLVRKRRLTLSMTPAAYVRALLGRNDVAEAVVTSAIAERAAGLPDEFVGDPMDRIIVATALELACPLVTRDASILAFARTTKRFAAVRA